MKLSALQILILPTLILALPIPVLVPESTSFLREQHAKSITDFAISNAFVQAPGAENFAEKLREYIYEHTDCVPEKPCGLINIQVGNSPERSIMINGEEIMRDGRRVATIDEALNGANRDSWSIGSVQVGKDFNSDEEL
ncbi:hypothetical protein B0J14DRAFT_594490 [Halenospora varia]|nr:hypothetical protein B0J14DRAFT_594490 [Halenospora varia]